MKRIWLSVLVVAPLIFAGACSEDDIKEAIGVPTPELLNLAACAADGFQGAAGVFDAIFKMLEVAETEDPLDPPEYALFDCEEDPPEFRAAIDLDEEFPDGVIDVAIWGAVDEAAGTDLCMDGFDVGETFTANWSARVGPGVVAPPDVGGATPEATGSGSFTITRTGQDIINVTSQSASLSGTGCSFAITSMNLTIDTEADGPPDGYINFTVNSGALTGTITMTPNVLDTAHVTVVYQGKSWEFDIDLDTFEAVFD